MMMKLKQPLKEIINYNFDDLMDLVEYIIRRQQGSKRGLKYR